MFRSLHHNRITHICCAQEKDATQLTKLQRVFCVGIQLGRQQVFCVSVPTKTQRVTFVHCEQATQKARMAHLTALPLAANSPNWNVQICS